MIDREMTIARRIVKTVLDAGFTISVNDGEEVVVVRCNVFETIIAALASTDCDMLLLFKDNRYTGHIVLVWGNGTDILSDHTDSPMMNELLKSEYD